MSSALAFHAIHEASVPLDRDVFLRTLIRELAGTLEEVVGLKDASGYISVVGRKIGEQMNRDYKAAWNFQSDSGAGDGGVGGPQTAYPGRFLRH
jgi:hypothetical protein